MTTRKATAIGAAAVIGIGAAIAGGFAIKYATADVRGKVAANERIKSAPSRIANYEHFFNLCAAVQANEAQIDALANELAASTTDRDRARVRTNITGVSAARQRAIFQYNADARKSYTAGQFRDSALPYELDAATYPEGGKTTCVA